MHLGSSRLFWALFGLLRPGDGLAGPRVALGVVGMRTWVGWLPPARYGLPFSRRGSGVKGGRMPISEADADAPLRLEGRGNTMQADHHQGHAAGGRALPHCSTRRSVRRGFGVVTRAVDSAGSWADSRSAAGEQVGDGKRRAQHCLVDESSQIGTVGVLPRRQSGADAPDGPACRSLRRPAVCAAPRGGAARRRASAALDPI